MALLAWLGSGPPPAAAALLEQCGWTLDLDPAASSNLGTALGQGKTHAAAVVEAHGGRRVTLPPLAPDAIVVLLAAGGDAGDAALPEALQQLSPIEPDFVAWTIEEVLQRLNEDVLMGCLVGVAAGDALGLGVEGAMSPDCVEYVTKLQADLGAIMKPWSIPQRKRDRFEPGQISDDTQCSRELGRAIVANGGFSIAAFTSTLCALHNTKGVIGQGPTSRATLDALKNGKATWLTAGSPGADKTTNGSIMRAGPIGLLGWQQPAGQLLRANAVVQSHLTHHAPLCKEGSIAVAAAVAAALSARASGATALSECRQAVLHAVGAATSYASMLREMLAAPTWQEAVDAMYASYPPPEQFLVTSPFKPPSISMFPPHTAGWAIYVAIHPDPLGVAGSNAHTGFWPALFAAIIPGGDTDTVAACAGAIAGAWYGFHALTIERADSKKVLDKLHDVDELGSCDTFGLRHLASQLFHVAVRQRGDWPAQMHVGGCPHPISAYKPAGLHGISAKILTSKASGCIIWCYPHGKDLVAAGIRALEAAGAARVTYTDDHSSVMALVKAACLRGYEVCVVTSLEDTGERKQFEMPVMKFSSADALRMLGVPVVVYDPLAFSNTLMRFMCGHHWIRHVAMNLADAVAATALLAGLSVPDLDSVDGIGLASTKATRSGKVRVLGISGSSRGGKGVLSLGLQSALGGANHVWVVPCDAYFNTMVIGQLGPSWWGGETDPVGDYEKTGQGNWDSPGAVDHNKLLADARLIISEAERSSAADGLDRIVIFEGFMLFYVRSDAALPTIISLTHEHQTRDASLISRIFAQDPLLVNLFDFQIWLELTYEVAVARRMATTPMPQSHYDNALWPNYCAYKDVSVFASSKIHTIDGTLPKPAVLDSAIEMLIRRGATTLPASSTPQSKL